MIIWWHIMNAINCSLCVCLRNIKRIYKKKSAQSIWTMLRVVRFLYICVRRLYIIIDSIEVFDFWSLTNAGGGGGEMDLLRRFGVSAQSARYLLSSRVWCDIRRYTRIQLLWRFVRFECFFLWKQQIWIQFNIYLMRCIYEYSAVVAREVQSIAIGAPATIPNLNWTVKCIYTCLFVGAFLWWYHILNYRVLMKHYFYDYYRMVIIRTSRWFSDMSGCHMIAILRRSLPQKASFNCIIYLIALVLVRKYTNIININLLHEVFDISSRIIGLIFWRLEDNNLLTQFWGN